VRQKLVDLKEAYTLEPESAKKAVAIQVFIEMCEASDSQKVALNFEEAIKRITNRLTKGDTSSTDEFGYIQVRSLLGIALGAYDQFEAEYMASRRTSA
jgi:hypothetical protein